MKRGIDVSVVLVAMLGFVLPTSADEPVKVDRRIDLLKLIRDGEVDYHLDPKVEGQDKPTDIWKFGEDGVLRVNGNGYGYVATKKDYRDYKLTIEFRWGEKTWLDRKEAARDNGILFHAHGPHGGYGGRWMASVEAQIIEGGVGDLLVLSPTLPDGTVALTSVMAEYGKDRDGETIWKPGEPRQKVTSGRVNWRDRDPDWKDVKGFRGAKDVESKGMEWTTMEVFADGATIRYFVNGEKILEAFEATPNAGKILLQTEAAEMFVRKYELTPLK